VIAAADSPALLDRKSRREKGVMVSIPRSSPYRPEPDTV
jgi:hypothetical protein